MLAAFFGRNEKFDLVGVNEEADLVVVLDGGKGEESCERCHDFALHLLAGAEFRTAGRIRGAWRLASPCRQPSRHRLAEAPGSAIDGHSSCGYRSRLGQEIPQIA